MKSPFNLRKADLYVLGSYHRDNINVREAASVYLGYLDSITIDKYRPWMGDLLFAVPHCSGSDYSGDSVTIANHRWFEAGNIPFENSKGETQIVFYTGGYSTYGVLVNLTTVTAETRHELRELLENLDGYPVIDEELQSEVEMQAEDDAWDSWLDYEIECAVRALFGDDDEELELDTKDTENDWCALHRLTIVMMDEANEYFEHEMGGGVYLNVKRLFEGETVKSMLRFPDFCAAIEPSVLQEYLDKTPVTFHPRQPELFPTITVDLVGAIIH